MHRSLELRTNKHLHGLFPCGCAFKMVLNGSPCTIANVGGIQRQNLDQSMKESCGVYTYLNIYLQSIVYPCGLSHQIFSPIACCKKQYVHLRLSSPTKEISLSINQCFHFLSRRRDYVLLGNHSFTAEDPCDS